MKPRYSLLPLALTILHRFGTNSGTKHVRGVCGSCCSVASTHLASLIIASPDTATIATQDVRIYRDIVAYLAQVVKEHAALRWCCAHMGCCTKRDRRRKIARNPRGRVYKLQYCTVCFAAAIGANALVGPHCHC